MDKIFLKTERENEILIATEDTAGVQFYSMSDKRFKIKHAYPRNGGLIFVGKWSAPINDRDIVRCSYNAEQPNGRNNLRRKSDRLPVDSFNIVLKHQPTE